MLKTLRSAGSGASFVAYALLALACLIWGSSFVFGKIILREMGALDLSFWRSMFAALFFLMWLAARGRLGAARGHGRSFALIGLLTVPVTYLLQFGALHFTSASHASIIIGLEPLTIALASIVLLKVRFEGRNIVAAIIAFGAVALIVRRDGASAGLLGDAMVLASTLVVAVWVVLTKKLLGAVATVEATAFITIAGAVMFLPVLPFLNLRLDSIGASTWLALFGLALSSSVIGHLCWNAGLRRVPSSNAGMFLSFEPIGGVALSVLILDEPFTARLALSLCLICVAIFIATCPARWLTQLMREFRNDKYRDKFGDKFRDKNALRPADGS